MNIVNYTNFKNYSLNQQNTKQNNNTESFEISNNSDKSSNVDKIDVLVFNEKLDNYNLYMEKNRFIGIQDFFLSYY